MIGDSLNLVEMIRGYIPAGFNDKIASLMGESRHKTQLGLNAAIPGVLSGLTSAASTPEGAQRLTNAVESSDDSMLGNATGLLSGLSSGPGGSGILSSILGSGRFSELTSGIGRTSGLSGKGVTTLLGFVAPIIMGALKNIKRTRGLDAGGLSSLLASQRNNFAAAMPESMPGQTSTAAAEPASYVREPLRDVSYRGADRRERTASGSHSWVLPLVVLLGLIGLLWYWASRPSTHAGSEPGTASERARTDSSSSLAALTAKYQSVIDQAQAQGIRISSLGEQNGKLVIRGTAPSVEAANNVWNEIKRINPAMNDIVADLPVLAPM